MSRSRWRALAAGATVVVGAATGAVTSLITSKGTIGLAVGLGFLLIVGVALQVALVPGEERGESIRGADGSAHPTIGQYARGRAHNDYPGRRRRDRQAR
jgi:hypothetical protein